MIFSSTTFLFFFLPVVIMAYYFCHAIKWNKGKNAVLLCASLCFYAWGEPVFVFVMIITIILNWWIVLIMQKFRGGARKLLCGIAVTTDVGLLVIFKYISFLSKNLAVLINNNSVIVNIALPIGISFFSFQLMSYVFDVYYQKAAAQKNLFLLMLYISFFPQLIAGPIVRYDVIERELTTRKENFDDFSYGIIRFTYGFGKKVLLANYLSVYADEIFAVTDRSVMAAWLGSILYTLQIYYDFSGYSDMAIGLGRIFGFHFPENFNYPYISKSVSEFWKRWHISLSSWFRDYVYIPMGGNRVKKNRWIINLFTVWILTGIWHGANWTFVLWGLLYFVILLLEKDLKNKYALNGWYNYIITFLIVNALWIVFRADTVIDAVKYLGNLVGISANGIVDDLFLNAIKNCWTVLLTSFVFIFPVYQLINKKIKKAGKDAFAIATSAAILYLSILACVSTTYQPFIYFNF